MAELARRAGAAGSGDRPRATYALWDEPGARIHLFPGGITPSHALDGTVTGRARAPHAVVAGGGQAEGHRRPASGGGTA